MLPLFDLLIEEIRKFNSEMAEFLVNYQTDRMILTYEIDKICSILWRKKSVINVNENKKISSIITRKSKLPKSVNFRKSSIKVDEFNKQHFNLKSNREKNMAIAKTYLEKFSFLLLRQFIYSILKFKILTILIYMKY